MLAYKQIRWLIPLNKLIAQPEGQVIFFPHAGGNAYFFTKLSKFLNFPLRTYAVELPGKGERINEAPFTDFDDLISTLSNVLMDYLTIPTIFLGHSMGALIAYECAKKIEQQNQFFLNALIVSAQAAPSSVNQAKYIDPNVDDLHLIKRLKELKGITKEVIEYPELLEIILESVRSDCRLLDTYHYKFTQPLSCPIACVIANEDTIATTDGYEKWCFETHSNFTTHRIAGGHFAIFENENCISALIASLL